ncbi:MAG: hypothetical protein WC479_07810 [Candidatus Izemoplasmatales bacterium]|jgi:hypothetical protein
MAKNYSNIPKDGSARVIPVASGIKTEDATSTPQESPLAYTSAAVITIEVPENAAELIIKPSTDLRVSEEVAMGSYFVADGGSVHVIPVGRTDQIYIKGDSADGTLSFYFHFI